MKKKIILLSSLLAAAASQVLATESPLKDSLPGLLQKDMMLRPYVRDFIGSFNFPKNQEVLSTIESQTSFRQLNFHELIPGIPGGNAWVPRIHEFRDDKLQRLFQPYHPNMPASDEHMVFLANVLYEAGRRIFEQNGNSTYIEYAASIGHATAQRKMFSINYKLGKLPEAGNYLFCSAAQGNPDALLTLSEVYQGTWGMNVSRDESLAKLLCQEAANLGHQEAQFIMNVSTLTEGFFGTPRDYQQGIRKAKELADAKNQPAEDFMASIMARSGDAIQEGNNYVTYEDLDFLRKFLGWKDVGEQ